jgi:periplasmic divalent cation tolerance protein
MSGSEKKKKYIFIYTTFPSKEAVLSVTKKMIEKKLIVCANVREHDAIYSWDKRMLEEKEFGALFKTREDKWKKAKAYILKKHPNDTPVVLKLKIKGYNSGFEKWIDENLDK